MPTYDYRCSDCKKTFTVTHSITDHGKKRVACPKCGSKKVKQTVSSFFAITSHKS